MPTRYLHSHIMYALGLVTGPDDPGPYAEENKTMNKREFARYIKSLQKPDPKPTAYGVYLWRGDGMYQRDQPVATYTREYHAKRHADKINTTIATEHGYVVRPIWG